MKNLLLILTCFTFLNLNSQSKLNGYKYVVVEDIIYNNGRKDIWGISEKIRASFRKHGLKVFKNIEAGLEKFDDFYPRTLFVEVDHTEVSTGFNKVFITIRNIDNDELFYLTGKAMSLTLKMDYNNATKKALAPIFKSKYKFY